MTRRHDKDNVSIESLKRSNKPSGKPGKAIHPLSPIGHGFRVFVDKLEESKETPLNLHENNTECTSNKSLKKSKRTQKPEVNQEKAEISSTRQDAFMTWTGTNRLHYFAKKGDIAKCMSFIDKGLSILVPSSASRYTSCHYAVQGGHTTTAEALLRRAASQGIYEEVLHARARNGQTPLHSAFECGRIATAIRLIELGANLSLVDAQGRQPIDLCDRRVRKEAEERIKRAIVSFHYWRRRRGLVYFLSLLRTARNQYLEDYHAFPVKKKQSKEDDIFLDIMNPLQYLALAEQRGLEAENEWRFRSSGYEGGLEDYCRNGGFLRYGEPKLWQEGQQTFNIHTAHWRSKRTHSHRKLPGAYELPMSLFFTGTQGEDSLTRMLYELCVRDTHLPQHPQRGCQVPVSAEKDREEKGEEGEEEDGQAEAREQEEQRWLRRSQGPHAAAWRQIRKMSEPRAKTPLVRMVRNEKGCLYFRRNKEFLKEKGSVCPTTQLMSLVMLNEIVKKTVCEFL